MTDHKNVASLQRNFGIPPRLYQPEPIRPDGLTYGLDVLAGLLWIATIGTLAALIALLVLS